MSRAWEAVKRVVQRRSLEQLGDAGDVARELVKRPRSTAGALASVENLPRIGARLVDLQGLTLDRSIRALVDYHGQADKGAGVAWCALLAEPELHQLARAA